VSTAAEASGANRYTVREAGTERGWEVSIVDPHGHVVSTRPCQTEAEARTFASTVRQHVYWLSEEKFREYYRLTPPA
jgi:hypothetical protein